nr:hypothetical protein CFP56_21098 [Quercus suber]
MVVSGFLAPGKTITNSALRKHIWMTVSCANKDIQQSPSQGCLRSPSHDVLIFELPMWLVCSCDWRMSSTERQRLRLPSRWSSAGAVISLWLGDAHIPIHLPPVYHFPSSSISSRPSIYSLLTTSLSAP